MEQEKSVKAAINSCSFSTVLFFSHKVNKKKYAICVTEKFSLAEN